MRDGIPTAPIVKYNSDVDAARSEYIEFVQKMRDGLMKIKSQADIAEFIENVVIKEGYAKISEDYKGRPYLRRGDKFTYDGYFNTKMLEACQNGMQGAAVLGKLADKKQFLVKQEDKIPAGMEIHQFDGKGWTKSGNWEVGTYYITKGPFIIQTNFKDYQTALAYAQQIAGKKGSNGKKKFVPPQLENVHRVGRDVRENNTHNVTGEDLLETFKFKGGEFGNWLNQQDRQVSLNYAYDALTDLADLLGISPADISLGGELSIAFGARGEKGAAAHYESERTVINLTKMNGAGSLGHEWAHALDNMLGRQYSKPGSDTFATDIARRTEIESLKTLVDDMKYKPMDGEKAKAKAEKEVENYKSRLNAWLAGYFSTSVVNNMTYEQAEKYKQLVEGILSGAEAHDDWYFNPDSGLVKEISDFRKALTNRGIPKEDRQSLASYMHQLNAKMKFAEAPTSKEETDFYKGSKAFGKDYSRGMGDGYWDSDIEMFARAFACYLHDKAAGIDCRSDYLAGHSESAVTLDDKGDVVAAIPQGAERLKLNEDFDNLIAELKDKGILHTPQEEAEEYNVVRYSLDDGEDATSNTALEEDADDVVQAPDGTLAVRISSAESGLNRIRKGRWASEIARQIRTQLAGRAIIAADGDIIRITERGAREVPYGTNSNNLRAEDPTYEKIDRKMITAEHAASIISLSRYSEWTANIEDARDNFKRDGLNKRAVNLYIDDEAYTATVLTALNDDPNSADLYGEKFYDIVGIEKQTSQSATSGAAIEMAASPHKIKYADGSSDMLTINQKNRIVNNREHGITYSGAGTETDADIPEWQRRLAGITFDDNGDMNGRFSLDDGEVIPLSERFNEKSRDIRFSLDEEYAELDTGKENDDRELRSITEKEKIQKEIIEAFSGFVYTENNLKIGKQENEMLISNIKSGNSIVAVGTEIYQIFSNKYYYIFTMNSSGDALINFKTSNNSRLVNYVRGILNENNGRFKQFGTDTSQETTNTSVGGEQTERSPDNYSSSFVSSGRGRANHDGNDNYQWNEPEPNRRRGDETVSKENSLTDGRYSLDETGKREWNGVQGLDLGGLSPDEYIEKAMARAAADRADRLRTISRDDFKASESLEALGVKISGSAGIYERLEMLKQADKMAKNIRRQTDKAERRLKATAGEKAYAKGIASGLYPASSIPAGMNADTVMELSDWYFAEQGTGSDLISRQKRDIAITLDAKISRMMDGVDTKKLPKNIVLNAKTPARNMRHLFGDKNGEKIYQEIFAPVAENEAERYRFINRQYDDVREFEDSTGKKRPLNKTERKVVQLIIENEAAGQAVAEMEMSGDDIQQRNAELVKSAAEQILKGTYDASIFEGDMKMAELAAQYAQWQQSQQLINSGKADSVKCQNAAKAYQEKFSQFYNTINDFLVAHGYEPIGFIKNYAPHMQEEATKNLLQKTFEAMGMSSDVTNLPTEIAGMTASYKPNKRWNPYFLSRNNGQNAKLDIAEAYESYVDYMSDVLYHTDDIMRVRAFERYLRSTYAADNIRDNIDVAKALRSGKLEHQVNFLQQVGKVAMGTSLAADDAVKMIEDYITEQYAKLDDKTKHGPLAVWLSDYANKLAAKQLSYDRGVENLTGRRVLNFANKMQKQFAMSQVGGKVSSVLNQGAQLPQIYAELGGKYTALAAKDAIFGRMRRNEWGQQSDFLTGKNGIDYIVTDIPGMLTNWLFTPADIMDGMVSTIAVRGAYLKAINEGLSEREAMKKADKFGEEVMGSRMKGTKPLMFESKNPIVKMATVFQIEALNSWEHIVQDLPRDFREIEEQHGRAKAALALSGIILKALIAAFALNRLDDELYGGTPAPFDILGLTANFIASGNGITTNEFIETMIDDAWEKATGERLFDTDNSALNDGKFSMAAALSDTEYNIMNELPIASNLSALLGIGDKNLPMAGLSSIGDVYEAGKGIITGESDYLDLLNSLGAMAMEFLPGGSQMKRTYQGLQAFAQGGEYDYKGNLKYAVGDDPLTAARMALFGKYSTPEAQSYYAAKDAKLTAGLTGAQTRIYKVFAGNGYGNLQAQQLTEELVKALGGSTKQVDVEAAIRAMSLPRDLAATIWQSFDKSWSPSKNPFSTSIGQKIYNELNGGN